MYSKPFSCPTKLLDSSPLTTCEMMFYRGFEILCRIVSMQNMPLQPYNPSTSNTSKQITCGSSLCYSLTSCANESDDCGYTLEYLSDNTSSSGVLFEDVIHLASTTTGNHGGSIEFPFVFGYVFVIELKFS